MRIDWHSSRGVVSPAIVLIIVILAAGASAFLLYRTVSAAMSIDEKADSIAQTGRGINIATDSVIQLQRTNETAESILGTAEPLEGQLTEIVDLANSIDGLAASINGTAGEIGSTASAIDGTAGDIDATASGINSQASGILDVAQRIDADVQQINQNLDETIGLAGSIQGDTGTAAGQAVSIHQTATCIDQRLLGERGGDGHCENPR